MKDFLQSKTFKAIILAIGIFAVLTLVFSLGVFVGAERADFSFKWAEQYHRNFGGPQGGFIGNITGLNNTFMNSNGSFGQIIKIDNNIITVKDNDGDETEKTILVGDKTIIIYQRKNIKLSDLQLNENIVVIGQPNNNGQIQAELIRVMPQNPQNFPAITNPSAPATNSATPAGGMQ